MKTLVLFNNLDKFHLYKEIGMIPYYGLKILKWEPTIVCLSSESNKNLDDFRGVPILKMDSQEAIFDYIKNFSTKYDMLILLSGPIKTLKLYKKFNSNGITYIKLDSNYKIFEKKYLVPYSKCTIIQKIRKYFRMKRLLKKYDYADMVSIETAEGLKGLQKIFYKSKNIDKFFCLSNGFDDDILNLCSIEKKTASAKENIILTSGRLGTYEKNTEYLFCILESIKNYNDWKVYFLGSIEKSFENKVNTFLKENDCENRFVFLGNISDRCAYYEIFNKSKIFILPSLSEGFPLVLPEALFFGNFVIGTDVSGMKDIIVNDSIGKFIPLDSAKKSATIIENELILSEKIWNDRYKSIVNHGQNFIWSNLIDKINKQYHFLIEKNKKS